MYLVGDVPIKAKKLVQVTHECLMLGIAQARPGNRLGDVANAIQTHAEAHRYSVVRDFCGHGLGRVFHDAPEVVHAASLPAPRSPRLSSRRAGSHRQAPSRCATTRDPYPDRILSPSSSTGSDYGEVC